MWMGHTGRILPAAMLGTVGSDCGPGGIVGNTEFQCPDVTVSTQATAVSSPE